MGRFAKDSIGLDIGSRFIKMAELKKSGNAIVLNKFGIKEIPRDIKADRSKVVAQLISEMFSENNIKPRKVNISAGGQSVFIRFVKLLQAREDKLKQTMKFEAQNQIPFPLKEVAWDWSLLEKEKKFSKRAVIVAIKKNIIDERLSTLKQAKLSADAIDVSSVSLYNCILFNEDYEEGKLNALLEIGSKTSNLIIFKKGNVWMRSFPAGCSKLEASGAEGVDELVGEMERSVEYYFMQSEEGNQAGGKPDCIILTGGGSSAAGLEDKLYEKFGVKPKRLDPFRKLKVSKELFSKLQEGGTKSKLGIAIGLALRPLTELSIDVNFLKEITSRKQTLAQKTIYSRLSIGAAILTLISFSLFSRQDYSVKRAKLDKIEEMLKLYETYEPKIEKLEEEKEVLKSKIDALYQAAVSRALWLDIFRIISGMLPEEVWITDVSGIVSLEKTGLGRMDLSGKALSYQSVNTFVSSLKTSPSFKDVKPISSSMETEEGTGEEIVKFSITMDVVVPER